MRPDDRMDPKAACQVTTSTLWQVTDDKPYLYKQQEMEAHPMEDVRKGKTSRGTTVEGEDAPFTGHGVDDMKVPWSYYLPFIGRSPIPPLPPATFADSPLTAEIQANVISRHIYQWIQPILILGHLRTLEPTDCYRLDTSSDSALISAKLDAAFERRMIECEEYNERLERGEFGPGWVKRVGWMIGRGKGEGMKEKERIWRETEGRRSPSLFMSCNEVFKRRFWVGGIYKLVADCLQMLTPLVIKYIIQWVSAKDVAENTGTPGPNVGKGVGAAIGLFFMLLVASICNHTFAYHGMSTGVLLRGGLIASIYERSLKLTGKARAGGLSSGVLVNFISTDVSRIDFACGFFHIVWTAPIQVVICLVLLCINLGPAALAGFAFFCIVTPLQTRAMKLLFSQRLKAMVYTDQRARLISELLGAVKLIKFFAWEVPYLNQLNLLRTKELSHIKTLLIVRGANMAVAITLPVMASVISFLLYGAEHGGLSAADVFASLSLFQLLRVPLTVIPLALSSSIDAYNAFGRLTPVFVAETLPTTQNIDPTSPYAVLVRDAFFRWETPPPEKESSKSNSKLKPSDKKDRKNVKADKKATRKAAKAGEHVIVAASGGSGAGENDAVIEDVAPGEGNIPRTKEIRNEGEGSGQEEMKKDEEKEVFSMAGVNLSIPKGSLTAIVGSVGCGKSSLLQGLIGEMARTSGEVVFSGSLGYVPQTAWLVSATIRENILFGQAFEEERYWAAVRAASLEADFETLSGGDGTVIGERGINVSGGQRQRISMARLIYFDADIVLLDDPLSAVDAHVGRSLFTNAICGALASKTRLLVTHQLHFLPEVDYIITLDQGVIAEHGTYAELRERKGAFSKLMDDFTSFGEEEAELEKKIKEGTIEDAGKVAEKGIDRDKLTGKKGDTLIVAEERYTGAVGFATVREYFKAANGKVLVPILILMICLSQVATVLASYFLVWWQEDYFGIPIGGYMAAYAGLAVSQAVFTFFMGVAFAYITYYASVSLHFNAIARVLRAPSSFFDTTPLGRIQNRLGKDMDTIDNRLGDDMRMLASTLSQILGTIILIGVVSPYFLIAAVVMTALLYVAASFYRASARELKRIDSILRSNIYSHFGESLTGLATIRAYGEQQRFLRENCYKIDLENRAYYMTVVIQRWLSPRIDLLGNLLALCVSLVSLFSSISPSQSGLILGYVVGLVQSFAWLVRQAAEVENDSTSAERILHYANYLEVEAPAEIPDTTLPKGWPRMGAIKFENVSMAYRPGLPNVLKNVSFEVQPREKIGICGRTGAGKSTIMTALFRIVELNSGKIDVDGIDISKLGLDALRQRLSIIPQEALLVSGTIRSNLDPFNEHDDATLNDALRRSYFIDSLDSPSATEINPNGLGSPSPQSRFTLDTVVEDEGLNFSVGQRSLVSLARALAKDAKIVVLDEATASVDFETDSKIQNTIRNHFKDKTLLCIAHRLKTIISYDRILVMQFGEIAEFDSPMNLFKNPDGLFRRMLDESGLKWDDLFAAEEMRLADRATSLTPHAMTPNPL